VTETGQRRNYWRALRSPQEVDEMSRQTLSLARAQVLAVSSLSSAARLDRVSVDAAIRATVRSHGGLNGCVAALAQEFGEYPETAPLRMRWAKQTVAAVYGNGADTQLVAA
jgi:hypothetical protein